MTWKVEAGATNCFVNRQSEVELINGKVKETLSCNQQQEQGNEVHVTLCKPSSSTTAFQQRWR